MAKYSKEIVDKICQLHATDSYSIAEICSLTGINEATYYRWKNDKSEFCDAIKKAQKKFDNLLVVEAKKSLIKKIRGYPVQEIKTAITGNGTKEITTTEKYIQPDTAAIIFTLCNRDSDNWKNKQDTNISGEMTLTSDLDKLSDEELENVVRNGGKIDTDQEV